jgi:pimeloyl-ACP methyl ester carboxylesterase
MHGRKIRWCALIAVIGIAIRLAAPGDGKIMGANAANKSNGGCTRSLSILKSSLGGYCRGPSKQRVIVFVNGIFGDAVDTWSNHGAYWPNLLAEDPVFDDSDIYVHSFSSPTFATAQEIDELAGRMSDFLEADQVFRKHKEVIFICHSMGGLITRAYLLKLRPSPKSVPMIYFFATPSAGANVAGVAANLSKNPQLKYMQPLDDGGYVGDLQNAWLRTSDDPNLNYPNAIASYCAYELKDTWGFRVVTRVSATMLCNRETRAVLSDHIGIVKPSSSTAEPYIYFKAAYLHTFSWVPQAAMAAINSRRATSDSTGTDFLTYHGYHGASGFDTRLRGFKSLNQLKAIGCDEDRVGTVSVSYSIPEDEEIVEIIPTVENEVNLVRSSVALLSYNRESALVNYHFHGPDKRNCLNLGRADIVVNIVTKDSTLAGAFPRP